MIEDLHTYTLDRFIPFTAETYVRLFDRIHAELWPAPLVSAAAGLAVLVFAWRGGWLPATLLLVLGLVSTAIVFQFPRYGELTPVGTVFGWGFLTEAVLLLVWRLRAKPIRPSSSPLASGCGVVLLVAGTVVPSLLAVLDDSITAFAGLFALGPDPTVIAVLGLLALAAQPRWLAILLPIPLLWCAVSGATLWVLETPLCWVPPAAGVLALASAVVRVRESPRVA